MLKEPRSEYGAPWGRAVNWGGVTGLGAPGLAMQVCVGIGKDGELKLGWRRGAEVSSWTGGGV